MWEPVKALQQSFIRTKKANLEEFNEMMQMKTNSSNNTVYADAEGNIAYYHGNFIPKRDVTFDYRLPVDGSNPATDWQGLHTVEEAIKVINPPNGWIQNCNSTPFTSAGEYSPKKEDYPRYMSSAPENFRGVHGGVFAVNTLLQKPALFNKYIAADASFQIINSNLPDSLSIDLTGKSLYICSSDGLYGFGEEISSDMRTNNMIFQNYRLQNKHTGLRFYAEHIADDHSHTLITGFSRGFRWIM